MQASGAAAAADCYDSLDEVKYITCQIIHIRLRGSS